MTPFRIRLLLLVLACQAVLLLWATRSFPRREPGRGYRLFVFGAAQLMALLGLVIAADLEAANQWYARWRSNSVERPGHEFKAKGDPSLVARVVEQEPLIQRPPLDRPALLDAWREELRWHLRQNLFGLHEGAGVPPPFEVLQTEQIAPGLRRRFIAYRAPDGTSIPGYLFEPASDRRLPAVLVLSGHGEGIVETAGLVESYQHGVARELARAGFVTFAPELRGFGYLGAPIANEHRFTAYNALLAGTFYKAVLVRDLVPAMDLLLSLPSVDPGRVAVTGASFGAEMSVTYAALDTRVRVVVAQAWSGEAVGKERGREGGHLDFDDDLCHFIPGHNQHLLGEDWFLLVAPRPLLLVRGDQERDPRDPAHILRLAYASLGRPDAFRYTREPGVHEYFLEPAIAFLRLHL